MATLKSTIKLESTDLFPSPVSFTVINNNGVAGDFTSFSTVSVNTTPQPLNVHEIDGASQTAYCYFAAPSSNTTPVYVAYGTAGSSTGSAFVKLAAGDVAFLPVGRDAASTPNLIAYTLTSIGSINYFVGNKD